MTTTIRLLTIVFAIVAVAIPVRAQTSPAEIDGPTAPAVEKSVPIGVPPETVNDQAAPAVEKTTTAEAARAEADRALDKLAEQVDQSPEARRVSAGVLQPIYALAEKFSAPWFHGVAFALMVAGVVSFALQLVVGKLIVLSRMSISFTEILSDALGLAVSLIGLVLTTQAAAENSTFTTSAFSVLSASGIGALAGLIFYWWGQKQELQAVAGRSAVVVRK